MEPEGLVTLDGEPVGTFILEEDNRVAISFNKGAADVEETLELAAENGMVLGLMLHPDYASAGGGE